MNIFEGIKVLDLTTTIAAPMATMIMGNYGAEVIKVEPPTADSWRNFMPTSFNTQWSPDYNPIYELYNANKTDICLNLKDAEAMKVFHKMLAWCDVFVTNNRPSALKKMGLDYDTLHKLYPNMIYATLTGYGEFGPEAPLPGYDTASYWARSGLTADLTPTGSDPVTVAGGFGDTTTGLGMLAAIAAALYHRDRTGLGEYVSTSLYGAALWASSSMVAMSETPYGNKWPKPRNMGNPINGNFWTKDGEMVNMTVVDWNRYFKPICEALGTEELIDMCDSFQSMLNQRTVVFEKIEAAFAKLTAEEVLEKLHAIGVTCSRMKHWHEQWSDPQAKANNYIEDYEFDNGVKMVRVNPPFYFKDHPQVKTKNSSKLGEDTIAILKKFGYNDDEIKNLIDTKAAIQHA